MYGKPILTLFCAFVLSACSFSGEIGQHAIEYNNAVAKSENEMLLRNIIRASKGRPMHFTRISEISGSLKGTGEASLANLFKGGEEVLGLKATGETNPTFGVQILNGQKFFESFVQPLEPRLFIAYAEAGYSFDVLAIMLIESAKLSFEFPANGNADEAGNRTTATGKRSCIVFRNLDGAETGISRFLEFASIVSDFRAIPEGAPKKRKDALTVKIADGDALKALAALPETFQVEIVGADRVEIRRAVTPKANGSASGKPKSSASRGGLIAQSSPNRKNPDLPTLCDEHDIKHLRDWMDTSEAERKQRLATKAPNIPRKVEIDLSLSSAEGAFFALGEMLNHVERQPGSKYSNRMFSVQKGGEPEVGAVTTVIDGETYWISEESRRSISMFSLARQIFSLSTEGLSTQAFARQRVILQ